MSGGFRDGRFHRAFSTPVAPVDPTVKQVVRTIRRHSHAAWSRPIREAKTVTEAAKMLPAVLDGLEKQTGRMPPLTGLTDDQIIDEVVFERSLRTVEEQEAFYREFFRLAKQLGNEDREEE